MMCRCPGKGLVAAELISLPLLRLRLMHWQHTYVDMLLTFMYHDDILHYHNMLCRVQRM